MPRIRHDHDRPREPEPRRSAGIYPGVRRRLLWQGANGAKAQLLETVRLDPFHTSAHYKLAGYARSQGDQREFDARQQELLRLRRLFGEQNRTAEALEECVYTRPEALPEARTPMAPPLAVRFADASATLIAADAGKMIAAPDSTVVEIQAPDRARNGVWLV